MNKFINYFLSFLLSALAAFIIYSIIDTVIFFCEREEYSVTGTVYGKSGQLDVHKYSADVDYILAVHPDDSKKFKDFSQKVDFATYSKFNIGDKITFKEYGEYILKDYKKSIFKELLHLLGVVSIILLVIIGPVLLIIKIYDE